MRQRGSFQQSFLTCFFHSLNPVFCERMEVHPLLHSSRWKCEVATNITNIGQIRTQGERLVAKISCRLRGREVCHPRSSHLHGLCSDLPHNSSCPKNWVKILEVYSDSISFLHKFCRSWTVSHANLLYWWESFYYSLQKLLKLFVYNRSRFCF